LGHIGIAIKPLISLADNTVEDGSSACRDDPCLFLLTLPEEPSFQPDAAGDWLTEEDRTALAALVVPKRRLELSAWQFALFDPGSHALGALAWHPGAWRQAFEPIGLPWQTSLSHA
jgi:hypothetical protein